MSEQKIVLRTGFTRHCVADFEREVNRLLAVGWELNTGGNRLMEKHGLRIVCQAVLTRSTTRTFP